MEDYSMWNHMNKPLAKKIEMIIQASLSKSNTCFGTLPYSYWATLAIWLNPGVLKKL
jgi:hypothetical protein